MKVDIAYKVSEVTYRKRKNIIANRLNASAELMYSPRYHIGTKIAMITTSPAF